MYHCIYELLAIDNQPVNFNQLQSNSGGDQGDQAQNRRCRNAFSFFFLGHSNCRLVPTDSCVARYRRQSYFKTQTCEYVICFAQFQNN
jgi:hypothetical protein